MTITRSKAASLGSLFLIATLSVAAGANEGAYTQTNLVSDGTVAAQHVDAHLVDPWGLVIGPTNPAWISDRGAGVSTLYDGLGEPFPVATPLVVTVPKAATASAITGPTGIVLTTSTANQFVVSSGAMSAPSIFLFATFDGTIAGWAPTVAPTTAVTAVDQSAGGASFTGLARANNGTATFLYATDFHNGKVLAFDTNFKPASLAGTFTDPKVPADLAPFNIQNIGGVLFVTYAPKNLFTAKSTAQGNRGIVDIFDANGNLVRRFASFGALNAPWGIAQAPANFGRFSNDIIIGNFGSGNILAFDPDNGEFRGELRNAQGEPLVNQGLWALSFGNGLLSQPTNTLFFTAGVGMGQHGLYGSITATAATSSHDDHEGGSFGY